jgi:predicted ester cyclase
LNDQNKVTARRLVEEGFNKHNLKLIDEIFTADAQSHDPQQPNLPRGPEGVRKSMQGYLTAFPDAKITIERDIAEGDYVVQHLRTTGIQTGALFDIPATNKKTSVIGVITSKFKDGKIVETWSLFDQLGLMQQLGVVPPPNTATKERELVGAAR